MDIEILRLYCIGKPAVTEGFPFDETTLVFKVMGKMFALLSLDAIPSQINLKCDPEKALELRAEYPAILPGYHMNKAHWNSIVLDGSLSHSLVYELIDHSYQLVLNGLPKKLREQMKDVE